MLKLRIIAFLALVISRARRSRSVISNRCLPQQQHSAWQAIWQTQDEAGLIHTTGFDFKAFHIIHDSICLDLYTFGHGKGGRPARMDTYEATALALYYLNSTAPLKLLCQVFASPPSTTQRTLVRALLSLFNRLPGLHDARIEWPDQQTMANYADLVAQREPALKSCFGFVDGVWFPILEPTDPLQQNAYYNGWKACCTISNVICWAPDGCIIWARYNCPGSWHDVTVAQPLYDILNSSSSPTPFFVVADSGFASTDKVQIPLKSGQLSADPVIAAVQTSHHHSVTSIRQAAEWGMRVLQGGFQRLHTRLPTDSSWRQIIVVSCMHLLNLRTRLMGINQIRTVFDPSYVPNLLVDKDASRIHRHYDIS